MEALRQKWRDLPLRRFFMLTVLGTICLAALLSGLVIWGCSAFRAYLLPDPNAAYLTIERILEGGQVTREEHLIEFGEEARSLPQIIAMDEEGIKEPKDIQERYAIQRLEKSFDTLSPKRKLAYQACGVAMVAAPAVFSFVGIIFCSLYFYRCKIQKPLQLLEEATEKIAGQDLDFTLDYPCGDELGDLSQSFEGMRGALKENYKAMWQLMEERRLLQASVAHDLRNPIAIILGYTEYLQTGLGKGSLSREKLGRVLGNLELAAKRLEQYTESVRLLNQLNEQEADRQWQRGEELSERMAADFRLLAGEKGITLKVNGSLAGARLHVDGTMLSRILENLVSNALRYARTEIGLEFALEGHMLLAAVWDDGRGFPQEVLGQEREFLPVSGGGGHQGLGLKISRLFCQKHGGYLELSNGPSGAWAKAWIDVS